MPDIYLLIVSPNTATSTGGLPESRTHALYCQGQEGETEQDIVNRVATPAMIGCDLIALDASGGTTYRLDPRAVLVGGGS